MLYDRTTILALVGRLVDEGVEADLWLRRGSDGSGIAEVVLRPTDSLAKLTEILGDQGLDMNFDGENLTVVDRSGEAPTATGPLEPVE